MFEICVNSPVPNLKDLRGDFAKQLESVRDTIPEFQEFVESVIEIPLPKLLGLPDPIFSGYSNTMQELLEIVDAIKYQADTLTMMNIFKPLVSVIGGSLKDLLPKIPVLNFSIIDIVNGEINGIYDAVILALKNKVKLPFIHSELFENFSNPAKEALLALKMILVGYKELLITTMQSMIKNVLGILKISAVLPVLPAIPTVDQLKQEVLNYFPEYNSWYEIISNVDVSKIMGVFGLGALLILEELFIPNFSNYEQYLLESFNQIRDHFTTLGLSMLVDFVKNTLVVLGFEFPRICIGF